MIPGIIWPVVMYAPTRAIRPTRANLPFKFSALIFWGSILKWLLLLLSLVGFIFFVKQKNKMLNKRWGDPRIKDLFNHD